MKKIAYSGFAFLTPVLVLAQSEGTTVNSLQDVAALVIAIINNILVPLVFAIAFIVFIIGVFRFFIGSNGEADKTKAKSLMIWGIAGFFVMVSVWGLVRILTGTVGLNNSTPSETNQLPRSPGLQTR